MCRTTGLWDFSWNVNSCCNIVPKANNWFLVQSICVLLPQWLLLLLLSRSPSRPPSILIPQDPTWAGLASHICKYSLSGIHKNVLPKYLEETVLACMWLALQDGWEVLTTQTASYSILQSTAVWFSRLVCGRCVGHAGYLHTRQINGLVGHRAS